MELSLLLLFCFFLELPGKEKIRGGIRCDTIGVDELCFLPCCNAWVERGRGSSFTLL